MRTKTTLTLALALATSLVAGDARAFCGFYVSGADQSLYNGATMVVLMRDGRRTVLSMQNDYQGPPEDFALVIPVPEVLDEENVKTLPREIFDRVDQLAAPRLVEYWEQDPCSPPMPPQRPMRARAGAGLGPVSGRRAEELDLGVVVEAEFSVAEYDIVILSARDSSGLDSWLRLNEYNIPEGAEPALAPYVAAGTKFFVAKVAIDRVTFAGDRAILSPLRFHYDADQLELPVRLGLLNSAGKQDLIVHVLAKRQRYEVANYPNAFIPTNIRVVDDVRHDFGAFYDLLFRRAVAAGDGAVVTEYSWNASSCDPCPVPALRPAELAALGADVLEPEDRTQALDPSPSSPGRRGRRPGRGIGLRFSRSSLDSWVLTRLHHRYGSDGLAEDLVFRAAGAVVGGRGMPNAEGELRERGAEPAGTNNFQGRYVILHRWEGATACDNPRPGVWGGPPGQPRPSVFGARNPALDPTALSRAAGAAEDTPQVTSLGLAVREPLATLDITPGAVELPLAADPGPPYGVTVATPSADTPPAGDPSSTPPGQPIAPPENEGQSPPTPATTTSDQGAGGCGSCTAAGVAAPAGWLGGLCVVLLLGARRRRSLR